MSTRKKQSSKRERMKTAAVRTKTKSTEHAKESVRPLLTSDAIQAKIREMGKQIRTDFPGEPLLLVGVLKGAVLFLADLARQIPGEVTFDFIAVSSYGKEAKSSGQVKLNKDLDSSIEGKSVIVVEDILDTAVDFQVFESFVRPGQVERGEG